MQQGTEYEVVECGDINCKLCTATSPDEKLSKERAYRVYTCESPMCSLCREETDVLLDLFCPFNSIQDIKEITRKIINIIGLEAISDETKSLTQIDDLAAIPWREERPSSDHKQSLVRNEGSAMLRELLQSTPGNKNNEPELDITQNLKIIDETCLMDLALELQVDKLNDLPELGEEGIIEFI